MRTDCTFSIFYVFGKIAIVFFFFFFYMTALQKI